MSTRVQLPPPAMASYRSSYTHSMMPPAPQPPPAATRKRKRPAPNVAFHSVMEDDGRGHQREVVVIEDTPPPAAPTNVPSPAHTPIIAPFPTQPAYATRYALAHQYPPPPSSHASSTSLAPSAPPMPLPPRRTRAQAAAESAASTSGSRQLAPPAPKRRKKETETPVGSVYESSLAPSVSISTAGPSSAAYARKAIASKAYQNGFSAGTTSIKQWPVAPSTESVREVRPTFLVFPH